MSTMKSLLRWLVLAAPCTVFPAGCGSSPEDEAGVRGMYVEDLSACPTGPYQTIKTANVRKGPSTNFSVLRQFTGEVTVEGNPKKDAVSVWRPVLFTLAGKTQVQEGWMHSWLLRCAPAPAAQTTGAWDAVGDYVEPVSDLAVARLEDGRVLAAGGSNAIDWPYYSKKAALYDPTAKTWTAAKQFLATARAHHTLTALADGSVLAVGGENISGYVKNAERYQPAEQRWAAAGALSVARSYHTATRLSDGRVVVMGGAAMGTYRRGKPLASAEVYDPRGGVGAWSSAAPLATARYGHTATVLADGRVLVVGGAITESGTPTGKAEIYDPTTNEWMSVASLKTPRVFHKTVALPDGRVFVFGGETLSTEGVRDGASGAEIYDARSDSWAAVDGPEGHTYPSLELAVLKGGRVMAMGGASAEELGSLPSFSIGAKAVHVFDVAKNAWSMGAPMSVGRTAFAATLLGDGEKLLVVGGLAEDAEDFSYWKSSEVFSIPATVVTGPGPR